MLFNVNNTIDSKQLNDFLQIKHLLNEIHMYIYHSILNIIKLNAL